MLSRSLADMYFNRTVTLFSNLKLLTSMYLTHEDSNTKHPVTKDSSTVTPADLWTGHYKHNAILQTCKCHSNLIVSFLTISTPQCLCSTRSCNYCISILQVSAAAPETLQVSHCRKNLQTTFCGRHWSAQQPLSCFFTHLLIFRPSVLSSHKVRSD